MRKKMTSLFIALVMIIGILPVNVFAGDEGTTARVIVENTTFSKENGAKWDGTLIDTKVDIDGKTTMMDAVEKALYGHDVKGINSGYISEIDGLGNSSEAGLYSGWTGTLNDWFVNSSFSDFTLEDGDEIKVMYTCTFSDLGGDYGNNNKKLKNIEIDGGELEPAFNTDTNEYKLVLDEGTEKIVITPTAMNKNFQVRTYVNGTEYKRSKKIPVKNGDVITVKCGDVKWPTMNEAEEIPGETYTINVIGKSEETFADVTIRSQAGGGYLHGFGEKISVSSQLAEGYGYTDNVKDGVSALDALVKAQELVFGDDFTEETARDILDVSDGGSVLVIFGTKTYASGFFINGGYPNDGTESEYGGYNGTFVNTQEIKDDDVIDFFIYGDESLYSDYYTWVDIQEFDGSAALVKVTGTMAMGGYLYKTPEEMKEAAEPLEDVQLAWVELESGAVGDPVGETDSDGIAEISVSEDTDKYYLTAVCNDGETYVIMNPQKVQKAVSPKKTVNVTIRSQLGGDESSYLHGFGEKTEVAEDLAESYGYTDNVKDGVSALDALVKAQELTFGEDFTADTASEYLSVNSGYATKLFGVDTYASGFFINGGYPNDGTESEYGGYNGTLVNTQEIKDDDVIDFFTYGDTLQWSDMYTWIDLAKVGSSDKIGVTIKGVKVSEAYLYETPEEMESGAYPIEGAVMAWVDSESGAVGEPFEITDSNGYAEINADGDTEYLSAVSGEGHFILMNPVSVAAYVPEKETVDAEITLGSADSHARLYSTTDTTKTDLLDNIKPVNGTYSISVKEGSYTLEVFASKDSKTVSCGTIKLDISKNTNKFKVWTVKAYCTTSSFEYGKDYTIESLRVGKRNVTLGDSLVGVGKTFLAIDGDTYSFTAVPSNTRTDYAEFKKTGTVTSDCEAAFALPKSTASDAEFKITIPYEDENDDGVNDYVLETGQLENYYVYSYLDCAGLEQADDSELVTYDISKGKTYFYRVSNPVNDDAVTYGNYVKCSNALTEAKVTKSELYVGNSDRNRDTVIKGMGVNSLDTGDIYLNINEKGYLPLNTGETFRLYPYRNWLPVESFMNSQTLEPDFDVKVINIEGTDVIDVSECTENISDKHSYLLTAKNRGTAIVLVTYDALTNAVGYKKGGSDPTFFSAIWPENTGVFVVTVGEKSGLDTGMTINEGLNKTADKLSGDGIDSELDVIYYTGNGGAEYTFNPQSGTNVTMSVCSYDENGMTFGTFTSDGVTENADGTVTLSGLTEGKTVVRLEKDGAAEYQVIRSRKADVKLYKDGEEITTAEPGDKIAVKFNTLYHPANKFSGVYNMNAFINLTGEDGNVFKGTSGQYTFAASEKSQTVEITIPEDWTKTTYTLTGNIASSGWGSIYGEHRTVTYSAGKPVNMQALQHTAYFGEAPEIKIPVKQTSGEEFEKQLKEIYASTQKYLASETPSTGSIKGEWLMLGLARAGYTFDSEYEKTYLDAAEKYISDNYNNGKLNSELSTENSRMILALTALGADATDIDGYNLLTGLADFNWVKSQGNNGLIWCLIALDSGSYDIPDSSYSVKTTREKLINAILDEQLESGAWRIKNDDDTEDPDTTAMAVQALAPYYLKNAEAKIAVDKALDFLSGIQKKNGGMGTANDPELSAQTVIALTSLGIDLSTDERFVKNGKTLLNALTDYYTNADNGGGFHRYGLNNINQMSTEQSFLGLMAYYRLKEGKYSLYDMADTARTYGISIAENENGKISADCVRAEEGKKVTVTVEPNIGFKVLKITVNGKEQTIIDEKKAEFKMPAENVKIEVEIVSAENIIQELIKAIDVLKVDRANKKTYEKIKEIRDIYNKLTKEEQKQVDNYDVFLKLSDKFDRLLAEAIDNALNEIKDAYEEYDSKNYTDANWKKLAKIYNDGRNSIEAAEYTEQINSIVSDVIKKMESVPAELITVSFRLVGDMEHSDGVDGHYKYVTWIETDDYEVSSKATVYDLFTEVLEKEKLYQSGAENNYVKSITAPKVLGGYTLGEFDNGPNSGWMYNVNGQYPNVGLQSYELSQGDSVVWHYVDDYTKESREGAKYLNRWKEASDISPEEFVKNCLDRAITVEGKGRVTPELKFKDFGNMVSFGFIPADGYVIKNVIIDGASIGKVERHTYEGFNLDSRIKVVFEEGQTPLWDEFDDVNIDDWFYDDVKYIAQNGILAGTAERIFSPNASMTRAMLVTALYRMEGSPDITYNSGFEDVKDGMWYSKAIAWAAENGIVAGMGNSRFGIDNNVTREQIAVILKRYADFKTYNTEKTVDISAYNDSALVSDYAYEAIMWANAEGIVTGRGTFTLAPKATATRAEVAAMLHRFIDGIM